MDATSTEPAAPADTPAPRIPLRTALPVFLRIGLLSFGGPAGQIALMHDELVLARRWADEGSFRRGLNVAMLLPGPEAHQLVTFLGWRIAGTPGGLLAGLCFILPGAVLMLGLACAAAAWGGLPLLRALFAGMQPAVVVVVLMATLRLARHSLPGWPHRAVAAAAFLAIFAAGLPFPLVIALAALAGFLLPAPPAPPAAAAPAPPLRRPLRLLALWAAGIALVWLALRLLLGPEPWDGLAAVFLPAALVTFGGAYAVLPWIAERAVEVQGWLGPGEMLNGLALAESTPGPLILVNMYAGFFAGWPGGAAAGLAAGLIAGLYTFAPSFAMILAAAPYVDALQRAPHARRALAGVSAAVVGVVLNLAVWLGLHAIFPGGLLAPDGPKLALLLLLGAWALARRPPMTRLLAAGAAAGLLLHLAGAWAPG